MILLANDCYCSDLKVIPKNWQSARATTKKDWLLYYRFYDPYLKNNKTYLKGKLVRIKRMNRFDDLSERQEATRNIIKEELMKLKQQGYNPITNHTTASRQNEDEIMPETPFLNALTRVEKRIKGSKSTKRDLRSILNFVTDAAIQLKFSNLTISTISRKHIKAILNKIEELRGTESFHRYNKVRSYLMILFAELVELEVVEINPAREISKKQTIHTVRQLLTVEERRSVDQYLQKYQYRFWLFIQIFFHSGSRLTEIVAIRRQDVDLYNQTFLVTIKKGKFKKEDLKPIKDVAMSFWREVLANASMNDYIFSVGLKPGPKKIDSSQITRRWNKHVKKQLSIKKDLYSLKHLNLDHTATLLNLADAAAMASHTSTQITAKHYTVGEKTRQNNRLKKVNNVFTSDPEK